MPLIQIAQYRHGKNYRNGLPAIIGPRTYTQSRRPWQARLRVYLPVEPDRPDLVPVEEATVNISECDYSTACEKTVDQMQTLLVDNPDWTDFSWQMWTEGKKAKRKKR